MVDLYFIVLEGVDNVVFIGYIFDERETMRNMKEKKYKEKKEFCNTLCTKLENFDEQIGKLQQTHMQVKADLEDELTTRRLELDERADELNKAESRIREQDVELAQLSSAHER